MHDKIIDEIAGVARQFHRLVDPRTTTDEQAHELIILGNEVMGALREIFQPTPEQLAPLRERITLAMEEVCAEQKAGLAEQQTSVH